jgi:hypothetical protein
VSYIYIFAWSLALLPPPSQVDKNTLHKKEATEKQQKSIPAVNMRLQLGVARIEEVLAPTTKLLPLFPV